MEIEAAFDDLAMLHVGERTTLRVVLRNGSSDMTQEARLYVRASGFALHSASPYQLTDLSSGGAEHEVVFIVPLLVCDERIEYALDAYARRAGELSGIARFECESLVREATFTHSCRALPAFATDANRFEMFAAEADAGAIVAGRVIVTNTGSAPAALDEIRIAGDLEDLVVEGAPQTLAPQERRIVAVRGRVPAAIVDRSVLTLRASLASGEIVHEIGTTRLVTRSRAFLVGAIEPIATSGRGDEPPSWRITIANAGGATACARIALSTTGVERIDPGEAITLECTVELVGVREDPVPPSVVRSAAAALDAATIRHLRALCGLMRHVWALAVLCGDRSLDPREDASLAEIRTALRSVFDRLSIKLRMPHYPVAQDDVLDSAAVDALSARPGFTQARLGRSLAAAAELVAPLASASETSPVDAYRSALAASLSAYEDAALIDALVVPQAALDEALEAVLAAEPSAIAA